MQYFNGFFFNEIEFKILLLTSNERKVERNTNKYYTKWSMQWYSSVYWAYPFKKMFSLLLIKNNDTIMFLLCIYLSKGIEVKRCSGI